MSQNLNKRISQQKPNVSNIHNLEYLSVECKCRMPCSLFEHASCLIYNWCTYSTLNTSQLDARGVHGISAKFHNFQRRLKLLWQKRLGKPSFKTRSTRPIDAKLWKRLCLWFIFNIKIFLYLTPPSISKIQNISDILNIL